MKLIEIENGYYKMAFQNGNAKEIGTVRNGILREFSSFYENGQIECRVSFDENGNCHGTRERWHENGNKELYEDYLKGHLNGVRKIWDENGNIRYCGHFKNGLPHGIYSAWDENGKLECRKNFFEGVECESEQTKKG